ncbi:MAG: type III pantothenate kinase [Kiritimatiellae bacterium]|nr:type III pantothenate kinase [Kiritimatiellia bacterium]
MRLVCVDIGNTSATLGLYEDGIVSRVARVDGGIRANPEACADMVRLIASEAVEGVSIASVVPEVNHKWKRLVHEVLGCVPRFVTAKSPLGFEVDYPYPERIGADRLADAAGGLARYGAPLIVVDFGTALNFEVVDARPAYVGGVITPGLPLMTSYLHEKTALLPKVTLGTMQTPAVGKSTEEAIALGAQIGYRGIVRELLAHLQRPFDGKAKVVATGGYAEWVLQGSDLEIEIDPTLTLFGLGKIFENGGSD